MARKKETISYDVEITSNAESLFGKMTKAASKTGKALESELTDALNHAQKNLKDFAEMEKKVLAGSSDVTKPMYDQARKVAKASAEFMRVYNNAQSKGNEMTSQLTESYKALEEELQNLTKETREYEKWREHASQNIERVKTVQEYEQNEKAIESVLQKEKQYQNFIKGRTTLLEKEQGIIDHINEKYNDWALHNYGKTDDKGNLLKNPFEGMAKEHEEKIATYKKQIDTANAKVEEMRKPYEHVIATINDAYASLRTQGIEPTNEAIQEQIRHIAMLDDQIKGNRAAIEDIKEDQETLAKVSGKFEYAGIAPEVTARITDAASEMTILKAEADKAANSTKEVGNATKNINKYTRIASMLMHSFAKAVGKAGSHHRGLHRSSKGFFADTRKGFRQALRNIMRYGLGVRSLYFLFRRLRGATKEAFKIMAQQIPEVNQQVSSLVTNFNLMKANLATMVQPLLKWVVPAFDRMAHAAQTAMEWIAKLFATITGQQYIYRASSAWVDYADSVNGAAKAVNNLLGIDELNVLNDSSGSSGGGTFGPENIGYELVNFNDSIFQKLKEAWENADFTEIGNIIATKFRNALLELQEKMPGIEEFCNKIALSLATGINGIVAKDQKLGYTFGETIVKLINIGLRSISLFFDTVHWEDVGTFVADGINGFVENISPKDLAHFISSVIEGIETALITAVKRINWARIVMVFKDTWNSFSSTAKITLILLPITWALGKMLIGFTGALISSKLALAMGGTSAGVASGYGIATGGALVALAIVGFCTINLMAKFGEWYLNSDFHKTMSTGFEEMLGVDHTKTTTGGKHFVVDMVDSFIANVKGIFKDKDFDSSVAMETEAIGEAVGTGFNNGVSTALLVALTPFANLITDVKDEYKVKSPSKVFYEIGSFVAQGFLNAFTTLPARFASIWTVLPNALKSPINRMVDMLNQFLQALQTTQNAASEMFASMSTGLSALNNTQANINITKWIAPKIPYLAQGAVIPPNNQFLAMLGDQKQGTNIEAPLSTIQEAVANVLEPYLRQIMENTQILADKDYATYIGDREIAMANSRGTKQLGLSLIK